MKKLLITFALVACAHTGASAQFAGTWSFYKPAGDDLNAVINKTAGQFNFLIRPIAKSRLRKTNEAYATIEILQSTDTISVQYAAGGHIKGPLDQSKFTWARPDDGEKYEVFFAKSGDTLVHHFKAEDGERVNKFVVTGDTLRMHSTITSPQLKAPMSYMLAYLRK